MITSLAKNKNSLVWRYIYFSWREMAESCLLPKYFPSFEVKSTCSSSFINILGINRDVLAVYASDLGQTYENFLKTCNQGRELTITICSNHIQLLKTRGYNRQRSVGCNFPSCEATNHKRFKTRKFDRRLTEQQVQLIYSQTGIVVPIGTGKLMSWELLCCTQEVVELQTVQDWGQGEVRVIEQECSADANESVKRNMTFICPVEHCTKKFSTQRAVDSHILLSNCSFGGKERLTVAEKAKYVYAHKILSLYPSDQPEIPSEVVISDQAERNVLQIGRALKEVKSRTIFTTKQKEFIVSKFNIGKTTGNKVDPYQASEEMRLSGKFKRDEYLSGQQISSYFSRLAQQDRKTSSEDFVAAVDEDRKQTLKNEIEKCLQKFLR